MPEVGPEDLSWERYASQRFKLLGVLGPAPRSGGKVELHLDLKTGSPVAVKRVPHARCRDDPEAFARENAEELENPWCDAEVCWRLGSDPFALRGVCKCLGVFRDADRDLLIALEYGAGGDLFSWASGLGMPGSERLSKVVPVFRSLIGAVLELHAAGVCHGDVSLENALIVKNLKSEEQDAVQLIDFGMALIGDETLRTRDIRGIRGKRSYQAPEMHLDEPYDPRAADLFACGVTGYGLAIGAYPWVTTEPGKCWAFDFMARNGLEAFLKRRRLNHGATKAKPVAEYMTPGFRHLLGVLLSLDPQRRFSAVEAMHLKMVLDDMDDVVEKVENLLGA